MPLPDALGSPDLPGFGPRAGQSPGGCSFFVDARGPGTARGSVGSLHVRSWWCFARCSATHSQQSHQRKELNSFGFSVSLGVLFSGAENPGRWPSENNLLWHCVAPGAGCRAERCQHGATGTGSRAALALYAGTFQQLAKLK